MPTSHNPLLIFSSLPAFDRIEPEHIAPAMDHLLNHANQALETVAATDFPATWAAVSKVLDVATERLSRAWGQVGHLNSVKDSPLLRAAYNAALPRVTEFTTRLGADERLYAKYKAMDLATLNAEQKRARDNALRNFVLGGAELQGATKARFAAIQEKSAELGQKFSENALDATDGFAHFVTEADLTGVPDDVKSTARALAQADGHPGFKLTLKVPCYQPLMQFASKRELRELMYRAYVTRASDQAAGDAVKYDNAALMQATLKLRFEEASLLGFDNFAQESLATKMAQSPAQVTDFLHDLAQRAKPQALQDVADMRTFAAEHLGMTDPQSWDWPFIAEKLKEARYSYSEQEVKKYFTAPKVIAGLFGIIENLFNVKVEPDTAPVWHETVQFYKLTRGGQLLAQFYLDTPARDGKRGGAWMDVCQDRWVRPDTGQLQTPVAYLICNFAGGVGGKPALLTHDDVTTLFHEFGHGLHLMLTQVDERDVGMGAVEWDAIELPSQFMENFCWEWSVLRHMTAHVDTGEQMPKPLFDKMLAAKNFQTGLQTLRQIEFSLYDMGMHIDAAKADNLVAHAQAVRAEVGVLTPPSYQRDNTFNHVFGGGGGYAAGYYSYKWAELLSADAYGAFEESVLEGGLPNADTGRLFCKEILEVGGARPAMESFKAFRGREPRIDALLRHHGLVPEDA